MIRTVVFVVVFKLLIKSQNTFFPNDIILGSPVRKQKISCPLVK